MRFISFFAAPLAVLTLAALRVSDQVMVWAALDGLVPGGWVDPQGDTVSLSEATFGAQQLIVVRGE